MPDNENPKTEPAKQIIEIKRIEPPVRVKVDRKANDAKADAIHLDLVIKYRIQKYINLGVSKPDISSMIAPWNLNGNEAMAREFLALTSPGREIENPDEPKKEDDDNPVLPADAWVGLFGKYRELVCGTTEASDNYHYGDFMTILGCTLGHHVSVHYAGTLYPNFYVCNIGSTGETRKTTAANRAMRICKKLNYSGDDDESQPFRMLYQIGSIEALYDKLTGRRRIVLLFYSELGSLMAKAQQSGASNMITDLITLWDVPDRITPSTRHVSINCELPFTSIIACSTLEYLYKYISLENIYSGFANRWCFLYGMPKSPMPNPPPIDESKEQELLKEINEIRKWAKELRNAGLLGKTSEAEEMWNQYYIDFFNDQVTKTGLLPELMIRIPVFIWKIATLYAAQDLSPLIRGKDLHHAIRVGKYLERSMRTVFKGYSNTEGRKKEERVVDYLKKKGAVEIRYLYRALNMSADELNKITKPLMQVGIIQSTRIGKKDALVLG